MNGEEKELTADVLENTFNNCYPISNYLESLSTTSMQPFIMPESLVLKYGRLVGSLSIC